MKNNNEEDVIGYDEMMSKVNDYNDQVAKLQAETFIKLKELSTGKNICFKLDSGIFIMHVPDDFKHSLSFFGALDENGKPYITGGTDEDYFINRNISNPDEDFKNLLKFYRCVTEALSDDEYRSKLNEIMVDYYMKTKDISEELLKINEVIIEKNLNPNI